MHKTYIKYDFDSSLGHIVEECGEVLMAAGKGLRFGWDSVNPELPYEKQESNILWLRRELKDLRGSLDRLEKAIEEEFDN